MGTTGVLGFNRNKIFTTNTKFYFKMYEMLVIIAVFVNILDVILFLQTLHVISNHCSSSQESEYYYNVLHLIINHFILTKVIEYHHRPLQVIANY